MRRKPGAKPAPGAKPPRPETRGSRGRAPNAASSRTARSGPSRSRPGGPVSPTRQGSTETSRERGATVASLEQMGRIGAVRSLGVLLCALCAAIVILPHLSLWMSQQEEFRELKSQLQQTEQRNEKLRQELADWQDPAFISSQARTRLGFARPGENVYLVVDAPPPAEPADKRPAAGAKPGVGAPAGAPWFMQLGDSFKVAALPARK